MMQQAIYLALFCASPDIGTWLDKARALCFEEGVCSHIQLHIIVRAGWRARRWDYRWWRR
jgi:hypothetical protein